MNLSDYTKHDALGLAALIASREVSAAEVTAAALQAVEAVNPTVNAVVESWGDESPRGDATRPRRRPRTAPAPVRLPATSRAAGTAAR